MEKCYICGREMNNIHVHLKYKHNLSKVEYLVKYRKDLEFTVKENLKKMYYDEGKSLRQICKIYEDKFNLSNLKPIIRGIMKYFGFKLRSTSKAQKNFLEKSGGVWNKGLTKEKNYSVKKYAYKKKKLYEDLNKALEKMEIKELLEYFASKKVRKIVRKKIIEKQNNKCPLCDINFNNMNNRKKHIHHIDRDASNNLEENLIVLCQKCHFKISRNKHRLKEIDKFNTFNKFFENKEIIKQIIKDKIKSKEKKRKPSYRNLEYKNCEICGDNEKIHAHHINEKPYDNRVENLVFLCKHHHDIATGFGLIVNSREEFFKNYKKLDNKGFDVLKYNSEVVKGVRECKNLKNIKLNKFVQLKKLE